MQKLITPVLCMLMISLQAFVVLNVWKVKESEASVKFSSGKINGSFKGLKADINFNKEHPEQGKISASIESGSIATGFFLKTNHAKDALGSDKYPLIKFVSTSVAKSGNRYITKGNLTLKGVTKPASINFTFEEKGKDGIFKGKMTVSPKDFGINRSGTPEKVAVELLVPVTSS